MFSLPKEIEEGNIEYKRELINITEDRLNHLASQMKWRINEGNNKAVYYLGINDDGSFYGLDKKNLNISIKNIKLISKKINSKISKLERFKINNKYYCKIELSIINNIEKNNCRIIFIGDSQSGKSTTISILLNREKDNGKGTARISLFNHKHELYSGKTSSISMKILGFKNNVNINKYCLSIDEVIDKSDNIYNLIDFPGDLQFYKTIFTKLNVFNPNLIFLTINPFTINYKIIKLYLHFCKLTNKYFCILFTNSEKKNFSHKISNIINFFKNNKIKLINYINNFDYNNCYYISISNVTLHNINKLQHFILNITNNFKNNNNDNEIQIISKYNNNELGDILSGICISGKIKNNNIYNIDNNGKWEKIKINNLHLNQKDKNYIKENDIIGIYFNLINYKKLNKISLITDNINKYKFINSLNLNIYYTTKKIRLKKNMTLTIFIRNNIYLSKIININCNTNIKININMNILNICINTIIFKINNIFGIAKIIDNI